MKRLSIAAITLLAGCVQQQPPVTNLIPRPRAPTTRIHRASPISATAARKCPVVYAKETRASVTLEGKTWRMEYQPTDTGFRYMDRANEWTGSDDPSPPCANMAAAGRPLAFKLPAVAADDLVPPPSWKADFRHYHTLRRPRRAVSKGGSKHGACSPCFETLAAPRSSA